MLNSSGVNTCIAIDKAYGRGLNLKFAKDAVVIVVCNDEKKGIIHLTEAAQLAGRSNRRQGLCKATVFMSHPLCTQDSRGLYQRWGHLHD